MGHSCHGGDPFKQDKLVVIAVTAMLYTVHLQGTKLCFFASLNLAVLI